MRQRCVVGIYTNVVVIYTRKDTRDLRNKSVGEVYRSGKDMRILQPRGMVVELFFFFSFDICEEVEKREGKIYDVK